MDTIETLGPVQQLLSADHARLDGLLQRAPADPASYDAFRRGLLRHIGIEEKVLFPYARRAGVAGELLERLRQDHSRLVSLLVPPPTPALLAEVGRLLVGHNAIEEGPQGIYALCERLARDDAQALLERVRGYPEVAVHPNREVGLR